ncbi:MAG: Gfo/Idh/MocA family oxidoreductase [Chlorobi bacterium]|nr:Gfo/Idh/MocA family oxidoreductase [Chlorobiota bacterium]MCI0715790.1 Gfo/Idh/MocA family oxidoreductase [Chlorobiota bacterium]
MERGALSKIKSATKQLNIGIIGCGYWGPNLIRNFFSVQNCRVKRVSDLKSGRLDYIKKEFPSVETTKDYRELLKDKSLHAVVVATPVTTHREIAEEAMFLGKHVFVEKPLAFSSEEAEALVDTAKRLDKKLAVGHVFQFAPAVRKIKELLKKKVIGKVLHITSTRVNLGPPESEVDVIWDLGPHDFSIILHLLNETPWKVQATRNEYPFGPFNILKGRSKKKLTNDAHIDLSFKSGITAHIHLSWLSSNKMRLIQIFGTEGTLVYDEMLALDGKLKLYGAGVDSRIKSKDSDSGALGYHSGDIIIIPLEQHEPLRLECQEFVNAVLNDKPLINNGQIGLDVVKLLETSSESFNKNI